MRRNLTAYLEGLARDRDGLKGSIGAAGHDSFESLSRDAALLKKLQELAEIDQLRELFQEEF